MLMDSWECSRQTWTPELDKMFRERLGYDLLKWMPANDVLWYLGDEWDHKPNENHDSGLIGPMRLIRYRFAEAGDSARIMRVVDAAGRGCVVWFPRGECEIASMLVVSNQSSLLMHKSARLKTVPFKIAMYP